MTRWFGNHAIKLTGNLIHTNQDSAILRHMKTILILALAIICGRVGAQTNAVAFPELRSMSGKVLMTNATYRCAVGEKLFFENAGGEHGFKASDLDPNVLSQLGMSATDRAAAQGKLNAQEQAAALAHQQFLQQQALAAQQAAIAEQEAESNAAAAAASQPAQGTPQPPQTTSHKSYRRPYYKMFHN